MSSLTLFRRTLSKTITLRHPGWKPSMLDLNLGGSGDIESFFLSHRLGIGLVLSAAIFVFAKQALMLMGLSNTTYFHSKNSLSLKLNSGGTTSFANLCKSIIPPCRLNPFLFNGHLQTIWTALHNEDVPIYYKRHTFENEDPTYPGSFAVDFVTEPFPEQESGLPPRTAFFKPEEWNSLPSSDHRPMLVILHGLAGGSQELYLRLVLKPLIDSGEWAACVINARGCSMTKLTSGVFYNARATWDVRQSVKWLQRTFPNRSLFGFGFSLGANIITNYIGEEGGNCPLRAAVVLSSPWNLEVASLSLQRTWFRRRIYSRTLGKSMRRIFDLHKEQIMKDTQIDVEAVEKATYLHEFDRLVQGPTWGYPTEGAYYRDASSIDAVLAIRIPFLSLNAEDDAIAPLEALPQREVQETPYAVLCTTSGGGHLGWFEFGGGRWFVKATTEFLQKLAHDVDLKAYSRDEAITMAGQKFRPSLKPAFDPTRRKLH